MKSPLRYQISDYDCGPTSMLNAVSFLFEREQIPPELIRNIMLFSLDAFSPDGSLWQKQHLLHGDDVPEQLAVRLWTSGTAADHHRVLHRRSGIYGSAKPYYRRPPSGRQAVVVRLFLDEWHYVLLTGERDGWVYLFDPYYLTEGFNDSSVVTDVDHPFAYNRVVPPVYAQRRGADLVCLCRAEGQGSGGAI